MQKYDVFFYLPNISEKNITFYNKIPPTAKLSHLRPNLFMLSWQKRCVCFTDKTDLELMSFAAKKIMEYLRIKMYTSVVAAL